MRRNIVAFLAALATTLALTACAQPPIEPAAEHKALPQPTPTAGRSVVPQVASMSVHEVDKLFAEAGLVPILRYQPGVLTGLGTVVGSDPPAGAILPAGNEVTVLVAGAPVDASTLHATLEMEGGVVVAELSPLGGCGTAADVASSGDPFAALAEHYAHQSIDARLPVAALMRKLDSLLAAVDGVAISLPPDDASFGFDYPRVREVLAARSIPHAVLRGAPACRVSAQDRAGIRSLLRRAGAPEEAHVG